MGRGEILGIVAFVEIRQKGNLEQVRRIIVDFCLMLRKAMRFFIKQIYKSSLLLKKRKEVLVAIRLLPSIINMLDELKNWY